MPPELDEIVLKALQRNPEERWQTARDMGRALRRVLAQQEELIGPAEIAEWMAELFPDGEARKRRVMEIARMSDVSIAGQGSSGTVASDLRIDGIPTTAMGRSLQQEPIIPAGVLVILVGVVTVLTVVALDWLRQ